MKFVSCPTVVVLKFCRLPTMRKKFYLLDLVRTSTSSFVASPKVTFSRGILLPLALIGSDIICHEDTKLPAVKEFEATLMVLDLLEARPIFSAGYDAVIHIHTAVEEIQVTALIGELDKATKKLKRVPYEISFEFTIFFSFVKANSTCKCRFLLSRPLCLETFDVMPQLGRFCLRDEGIFLIWIWTCR